MGKDRSMIFKNIKSTVKRVVASQDKLCIVLMCILAYIVAECFLVHVFAFELSHAFTADSPLYWAVGRGILNGLCPYSELYENKPVGIFALSALSFWLTDDTRVCNYISILTVLIIMLVPTIAAAMCFIEDRDKGSSNKIGIIGSHLIGLLAGIILAAYCEDHSGAFQVEAIGTAFSMLFIYSVRLLKHAKTKKQTIIHSVAAAVFISCAVMMKEPFLLLAVAGSLLFIDGFKDFLKCIVIPCVAGGAATVAILAATGVLVPYFTIYIKTMFGTRLSGETSAFTRARDINMILGDMEIFDRSLILVTALFIVLSISAAFKESNIRVLIHIIRVAAIIYVASFCVGMGGQYYNHHFVFAAPVIGAFMIYGIEQLYRLLKDKKIPDSVFISCFGIILLIAFSNAQRTYGGDYNERFEFVSEKARYVDKLLDHYNIDRYQYIGFNGEDAFYGLTKHSPMGPMFAQDGDNFQSSDTWFSKELIYQINCSSIVFVKDMALPEMNDQIQLLLDSKFTTEPPDYFDLVPPGEFGCIIYYRVK